MFAEELKRNANLKKQEQARERRRRAKQQQQQQQQQQQENKLDDQSLSEVGHNVHQVSRTAGPGNAANSIVPTPSASAGMKNTHPDAVTKAIEQRKIRSIRKNKNSAANIIQAAYRSFKCICELKFKERNVLEKRLSDLETLIAILKKKQNKQGYVPPTSLAIAMVNQFLFLTHTIPRTRKMNICVGGKDKDECVYAYFSRIKILTSSDVKLLAKMLDIILLPGIISDDSHLDPTHVWLQSLAGRFKLKKILRLVSYAFKHRIGSYDRNSSFAADKSDVTIFVRFFTILIGNESKASVDNKVVSYCKSLLLPDIFDYSFLCPGGMELGTKALSLENLDLIHLLRSFLLYPSHTSKNVIPSTAYEAREKCIQQSDRDRGDCIFQLTLRAVLESGKVEVQSRFFAEIFSIPLLSWRIESTSLSQLVQYNNESSITKCTMLFLIKAFAHCFMNEIEGGLAESSAVFPKNDVPFSLCPVPSVLSLFANCVQLGYMCPLVNGNRSTIDFEAATLYFNFIAMLFDQIPLATYSSRQSSVEWINDGAHLTPVVLPQVVLDQCSTAILDSYVRALFHCAIDVNLMNVNAIINKKDQTDLKLEKDLEAILTESSTSVAAKEAMTDRNKGILGSKWARKLSKQISSVFSLEKRSTPKNLSSMGKGTLINTSAISRQLANGSLHERKESAEKADEKSHSSNFNESFFFALSKTYAIFLSRWGGTGGEDIVQRLPAKATMETKNAKATAKAEPCVFPLLNVLSFSTQYVVTAWSLIQSNKSLSNDVSAITDVKQSSKPIRSLQIRPSLNDSINCNGDSARAMLLIFVTLLSHILVITDDVELHNADNSPLPLHQIRRCILLLKNLLYRACCIDDTKLNNSLGCPNHYFGLSLISSSSKLMRDLHDRSSRRALCLPGLWLFENLLESDIKQCKSHEDYCSVLNAPVLRVCPFLVSFKRRLKLFEKVVTSNRESIQGRNDGFSPRPGVTIHIMRGRVLEDGLIHLNKLGRDLRQRIIVQYLNQAGAKEVGIDAGGLFKEFWTDLSELSFNLNYALFRQTEDGYMYPNPSSRAAHGSDSIILFEFLGRILGKALYEGITIKPQFAHFFLSFLRGEYNFLHMLPDLYTMDKTLYNNLLFLKTYDGRAEDLCLTFTVANDDFGVNKEIELIPNGANIDVTNLNKHRYIGLVAKHHVCDRVTEQSQAFTRGLWDVIDKSWLRIFNEPELQVLISGPSNGKIDIDDMKANSKYTGGYTMFDRNIHRFWRIASSLNQKQQGDLLRFVTSCERPPPLGFGSLNPPFTIQRIGIMMDNDKLPTASTCFNILKLPTYSSERVMRERLIYAIESGAGFELS